MLVVHPNNDDDDDDVVVQTRKQTTGRASDEHAVLCKKATFSLCMEIDKILKSGLEDSAVVSKDTLQNWFSRLKEANKSISRYVRTITTERDRADIELQMLKHAMYMDILDREASYTETLEAIASVDTSKDRVARAMRFVSTVNGGLSSLSSEPVSLTADVEKCASLRDGV